MESDVPPGICAACWGQLDEPAPTDVSGAVHGTVNGSAPSKAAVAAASDALTHSHVHTCSRCGVSTHSTCMAMHGSASSGRLLCDLCCSFKSIATAPPCLLCGGAARANRAVIRVCVKGSDGNDPAGAYAAAGCDSPCHRDVDDLNPGHASVPQLQLYPWSNAWVHVLCARWTPHVRVLQHGHGGGRKGGLASHHMFATDMGSLSRSDWSATCVLCDAAHVQATPREYSLPASVEPGGMLLAACDAAAKGRGVAIRCGHKGCTLRMHASCAAAAGWQVHTHTKVLRCGAHMSVEAEAVAKRLHAPCVTCSRPCGAGPAQRCVDCDAPAHIACAGKGGISLPAARAARRGGARVWMCHDCASIRVGHGSVVCVKPRVHSGAAGVEAAEFMYTVDVAVRGKRSRTAASAAADGEASKSTRVPIDASEHETDDSPAIDVLQNASKRARPAAESRVRDFISSLAAPAGSANASSSARAANVSARTSPEVDGDEEAEEDGEGEDEEEEDDAPKRRGGRARASASSKSRAPDAVVTHVVTSSERDVLDTLEERACSVTRVHPALAYATACALAHKSTFRLSSVAAQVRAGASVCVTGVGDLLPSCVTVAAHVCSSARAHVFDWSLPATRVASMASTLRSRGVLTAATAPSLRDAHAVQERVSAENVRRMKASMVTTAAVHHVVIMNNLDAFLTSHTTTTNDTELHVLLHSLVTTVHVRVFICISSPDVLARMRLHPRHWVYMDGSSFTPHTHVREHSKTKTHAHSSTSLNWILRSLTTTHARVLAVLVDMTRTHDGPSVPMEAFTARVGEQLLCTPAHVQACVSELADHDIVSTRAQTITLLANADALKAALDAHAAEG